MEARSRSSSTSVQPLSFSVQRSHSRTRHFNSPSSSSASNFSVRRTVSSSLATFSSCSSFSSVSAAISLSINFGIDRSASQVRSTGRPISPKGGGAMKEPIPCAPPRKTCMCSPTNHRGSFRYSVHRNCNNSSSSSMHSHLNTRRSAMTNHRGSLRCSVHRNGNNSSTSTIRSHLNARGSAMTNSLVGIGGVEGEWVRRALTALIRPSSQHMRRRESFQPRPSRLCHMTTAEDVS